MIATLNMDVILDEADHLNHLIIHSDIAERYRRSKVEMEKDTQAQKLIRTFIKKKEAYEEVERFGKYHPDYDRVKKEMREAKRALDMHEKVATFKKAEKELEKLLAEISKTIAAHVSETIKVPTGNAFFDEAMLNGGCGSGGCSGGCENCGN